MMSPTLLHITIEIVCAGIVAVVAYDLGRRNGCSSVLYKSQQKALAILFNTITGFWHPLRVGQILHFAVTAEPLSDSDKARLKGNAESEERRASECATHLHYLTRTYGLLLPRRLKRRVDECSNKLSACLAWENRLPGEVGSPEWLRAWNERYECLLEAAEELHELGS